MHRVGAQAADVPALLRAIADEPLLRFEGLWTHFPVADGDSDADRAFTRGQLEQFDHVVAGMGPTGARTLLHAANTAGAIAFPAARYNMVRCGIGLYGYLPGAAVRAAFSAASGGDTLRAAMSLRARVVSVRTLEAGERPSYGRMRALPRRSVVATVPVGYADGVPRALFSGGCSVLIGGRRRPLAGAVTMDQIMVDCGEDTSVAAGDEVGAARAAGRRGGNGRRVGGAVGHDQLRGPVRHRPEGPADRGQRSARFGRIGAAAAALDDGERRSDQVGGLAHHRPVVHQVRAGRWTDKRRLWRGRSPGQPPLRGRGSGPPGGPGGRAVRGALGQAPRPSHARRDRAHPAASATSPTW